MIKLLPEYKSCPLTKFVAERVIELNSSIYKYNEKSRKYILRKGINVGYDVPKSINWKIY